MDESAEDRAREAIENKEKAEARAREIKLREEAAKKAYEDMTGKTEAKPADAAKPAAVPAEQK